jgi:hypothetical protein
LQRQKKGMPSSAPWSAVSWARGGFSPAQPLRIFFALDDMAEASRRTALADKADGKAAFDWNYPSLRIF